MAVSLNTRRYKYLIAITLFFVVSFNSTMCGGDVGMIQDSALYSTRTSADKTPKWLWDKNIIVANIGDDIVVVSSEGNRNRWWKIPYNDTDDPDIWRHSPRLLADGRVQYEVVKFIPDPPIFNTRDTKSWSESANLDGTEVERVKTESINGRISPDGLRIAGASHEVYRRNKIISMAIDGSVKHIWPQNVRKVIRLAWSDDSDKIALTEYDYDIYRIKILNWDGTEANLIAEIPDEEGNILFFKWMDDGERIAYFKNIRDEMGFWRTEIYSSNSDGSDQQMISELNPALGYRNKIELSPDGSKLMIATHKSNTHGELYMLNIDGTDIKRIHVYDAAGRDGHDDIAASWSPDGSRIAVMKYSIRMKYGIYKKDSLVTMNPDGSDVRLLFTPR